MTQAYRFTTISIAVIVGFAVADLVWLPYSTVAVDGRSFVELAKVAVVIGGLYLAGKIVLHRLRDDTSRIAAFIVRTAKGVLGMANAALLFVPLGFCSTIFMYLASATDRPLVDANLAAADAALGFNWLWFLDLTNGVPMLGTILAFAYHALGPQMPALFLVHSMSLRADRLLEFVALLAVSSALTGTLMAFFPAAGAYAYFQPPPEIHEAYTAQAGMWHYSELLTLRAGRSFSLFITDAQGLVTFPSFHTALGILIVYSLRNLRYLVFPIGFLNGLMIIATLPEGGHHLIDVVAGAAIALAAIAAMRIAVRGVSASKERVVGSSGPETSRL